MRASIAAALLCAACASTATHDDRVRTLFHSYEGRPVSELAARLGASSDKQQVGAELWYVWEQHSIESLSTGGIVAPQCRLSARVDQGIVSLVRVIGDRAGCTRMSQLLK